MSKENLFKSLLQIVFPNTHKGAFGTIPLGKTHYTEFNLHSVSIKLHFLHFKSNLQCRVQKVNVPEYFLNYHN